MLGVLGLGVPAAALAAHLTGAGSAFIAPLEAQWANGFQASNGAGVSYQPLGSGLGIVALTNRSVDFGASEAPLGQAQGAACGRCTQIPWALSAVGIGYHVPGAGRRLQLSGPVLAQIYLGQITKWNDRRIGALNPRLRLPNLTIRPIYVSSGSGETYVFSDFLSKVSPAWRSQVGTGLNVNFPTGISASRSSSVEPLLASNNGAIAYVAVTPLILGGLPAAGIANAAGHYVFPNFSNIDAAASTVRRLPASGTVDIVNPPRSVPAAYPICSFSYAIVPANAQQKGLLKQWLNYAVGPGQQYAPALDFAPLPAPVVAGAQRLIGRF